MGDSVDTMIKKRQAKKKDMKRVFTDQQKKPSSADELKKALTGDKNLAGQKKPKSLYQMFKDDAGNYIKDKFNKEINKQKAKKKQETIEKKRKEAQRRNAGITNSGGN